MGPIFLFSGGSHTKEFIVQLHPSLEVVTEVDTDLKGRFVSFKVSHSNNRVLCFYAPSRHNTREQLVKARFFERLQNYMENKYEGNENKIIPGDLILLWIKWTGMVEIKHKDFIDAVQRPRIYTHLKFSNNAKTNHIIFTDLISKRQVKIH